MVQWYIYFKNFATEKDGSNKVVGLPKHDNMFQVIIHLRKKLSSPLQDNKTANFLCIGKMISPQYTKHNVKGVSKGGKTLNNLICSLECILEMTEITETSAAYFPPCVFASSGFFRKMQMTAIKTHMAYSYLVTPLVTKSGTAFCMLSLSFIFDLSGFLMGAQKMKMLNA